MEWIGTSPGMRAAVAFALSSPGSSGKVFHIDDGADLCLADIVAMMREAVGQGPRLIRLPGLFTSVMSAILPRSLRDQVLGGLAVSSEAIRASGWKPVEASAAGLARTVRGAESTPGMVE